VFAFADVGKVFVQFKAYQHWKDEIADQSNDAYEIREDSLRIFGDMIDLSDCE
jgi:hypothetical protein